MKVRYINEMAAFSKGSWSHGNSYDYLEKVINVLLTPDGAVKLGKDGNDGVLTSDMFDQQKLQDLKKSINSYKTGQEKDPGYQILDTCLLPDAELPAFLLNSKAKKSKYIWTNLYKGPFSGHDNPEKNKGIKFEIVALEKLNTDDRFRIEIQTAINNHRDDLEQIMLMREQEAGEAIPEGKNNSKRPLTIGSDGFLYIFPSKSGADPFNVGSTVTDITIPTVKGPVYLSCKYGTKVTFINVGIKPFFPDTEYSAKKFSSTIGNYILDMFHIDTSKFMSVFNTYNMSLTQTEKLKITKMGGMDRVDVTDELIDDDISANRLRRFVMSTLGYGYILVHGFKDDSIHIYDLMTKEKVKDLFGPGNYPDPDIPVPDPRQVVIEYPTGGQSKQLVVTISYFGILLKYTFRNKQTGVRYPTELTCDYKIRS